MSETGPDFGAAGNDSSSSPEKKRVTKSSVGRVSRRDLFKIAAAAAATFVTGGVIKTVIDFTPQQAPKTDPLSEQYNELLKSSDVQEAVKKASGTDEDKKTLLYNLTRTEAYLAEGDSSQWQGLIAHLEAEGPKAFYGQKVSLQRGGCLNQGNTVTINVGACELNHPGFKNLDSQIKQAYVNKFNGMAEVFK